MPKTHWSAQSTPTRSDHWRVPPTPAGDGERAGAGNEPKRGRRKRGPKQPAASKPRKHFVEPYPYTEEERAAIARALADCGLGDATAREIFIGAIAYDLAVLGATLAADAEPAPPAATSPPVSEPAPQPQPTSQRWDTSELAERAQVLAGALDALDAPARTALLSALAASDPFRRDYGTAYLAALHTEVARIASAAATIAERAPAEPPRADADRKPPSRKPAATRAKPVAPAGETQSALRFIGHAASVYEQCFDARPDPAPDAPFARALTAVGAATGIAIPTDAELLQRALAQR